MKQPVLKVVSYGEPDIESVDSVFYSTLFERISKLSKGTGDDLSISSGSVNEIEYSVKGTQAEETATNDERK